MRKKALLATGLLTIGSLPLGGCPQAIRIPVEFALPASLGAFTVQAGVPIQNDNILTVGDSSLSPSNGTLRIDPSNIIIAGAQGGGKVAIQQQGGTLTISAKIAASEDLATVCETGEEYGPFSVELDSSNQPVSVDPSSVVLSDNAIDLINVGEFALCIEIVSPIDGTVTITALNFSFGL